MAQAIEQALEEKRHLIVEAGTGTGKTLAYLVPVIRSGKRVIISTGTKNLQEQLFFKDVPFLEQALYGDSASGSHLSVCYMKHVIERLDHQMINDIEPFTVMNPSAENLAKYFYDQSNSRLQTVTNGRVRVKDVTVFETDTTTAKYSE